MIKSHIIPKKFRDPLKDSSGKFKFRIVRSNGKDMRSFQDLPKEALLCAPCDNKIGLLDDYAYEIVFRRHPSVTTSEGWHLSGNQLIMTKLDYVKLRKFELSLIYRMSKSKHPLFDGIDLGPKYHQKIEHALQSVAPPDPFLIPCMLVFDRLKNFVYPNIMLHCLMVQPYRARLNRADVHGSAYRCWIGGVQWMFFTSTDHSRNPARKYFLQSSGERKILIWEHEDMGPVEGLDFN